MTTTEATDKGLGLRRAEYRGAQTVAVYSDTRNEFRALVETAGIFDLGWRAKLLVSGRDRVRWLNGMITNNVRDLAAGQGIYSFLLTPQGKILGDLYAYNRGEFLALDTDQAQAENLVTSLRKYIIMDKVEIANAGDKIAAIGVAGPQASEVLKKIGIEPGELKPLQAVSVAWRELDLTVVRGDFPAVPTYEIWFDPAHLRQMWEELERVGAVPAGSEAFELFRIACGVPRYGQDIRERDLPQETEQWRALNFTKGCYIGQEIVERIRSRGAVHRQFTGFKIEGSLPAPGAKAQIGGRDVAEITSTAKLPTAGGELAVGLGYVRREALGSAEEIDLGGTKATIAEIPFQEVFGEASRSEADN